MAHTTPHSVTVAGVGPLCKVAYSKGMAPGLVARMVVALSLAIAGSSYAQRRPVAVIDLSGTQPARTLSSDLYQALISHSDLAPLASTTFIEALRGAFADEDTPHLDAAHKRELEAEDSLAQLDDAQAAKAAASGMQELTYVDPTNPQILGLYADLAFSYGQAQIGLRRPNEASLAFALAHRLDPLRRPDPTRYQPNIVQAYAAAAAKQTIAAKLEVKGEGRVWIDGIDLGPAGGTFDTSEGMHLVQLTGPERETRGDQVTVPAKTTVSIAAAPATKDLLIKRARIKLAKARDVAERASAMNELARLLDVGDAVLIDEESGHLSVQTWRNQKPGFSSFVSTVDKPPNDLLTPLAPLRKLEPPITPDPFRQPPPIVVEKRWYEKNWVRASIAGGVIAGIVTAVLYARRDQNVTIDMNIQPK